MGSFPWGPHGPEVAPNTVRPNPTAASPAPAFEQPNYPANPVASRGGGIDEPISYYVRNFLFSFFLLAITWEAFVCLYPLTSVAGVSVGFVTFPFFLRLLPADGRDVASVLAIVCGFIVGGIVSRIEYRLAQNAGFRLVRHVIRIPLLSIWAIPIIMLAMGATAPTTTTRFILAIVSSPSTMFRFLSNPINLGIWFTVMVALHFIIWNWTGARRFWHNRLKFVGLK